MRPSDPARAAGPAATQATRLDDDGQPSRRLAGAKPLSCACPRPSSWRLIRRTERRMPRPIAALGELARRRVLSSAASNGPPGGARRAARPEPAGDAGAAHSVLAHARCSSSRARRGACGADRAGPFARLAPPLMGGGSRARCGGSRHRRTQREPRGAPEPADRGGAPGDLGLPRSHSGAARQAAPPLRVSQRVSLRGGSPSRRRGRLRGCSDERPRDARAADPYRTRKALRKAELGLLG
jgi:hypothetical protein